MKLIYPKHSDQHELHWHSLYPIQTRQIQRHLRVIQRSRLIIKRIDLIPRQMNLLIGESCSCTMGLNVNVNDLQIGDQLYMAYRENEENDNENDLNVPGIENPGQGNLLSWYWGGVITEIQKEPR